MVGSSFQTMGAATEKARLPRFSLVLGIESCCEVDDLSCLGMLEIYSMVRCFGEYAVVKKVIIYLFSDSCAVVFIRAVALL